jgi:hypothetical protein
MCDAVMKASAHALAETARAASREVRAVLDTRICAVSMHGEEIRPRSREELAVLEVLAGDTAA